jgi:hypothetical protein
MKEKTKDERKQYGGLAIISMCSFDFLLGHQT